MQEINDELMMPCAQCCRKHLSAAIAYMEDVRDTDGMEVLSHVALLRAEINLVEADEGYASHRPFAIGLLVKAEEYALTALERKMLREYRLRVTDGEPTGGFPFAVTAREWVTAHLDEAEREYPDIRTAVEREPFYRDNMSGPELRQAEVNYRLAQLKWLDENVFGTEPKEKGEADMATKKAAVKKAGVAKAPAACAKKAACKGGKCGKKK